MLEDGDGIPAGSPQWESQCPVSCGPGHCPLSSPWLGACDCQCCHCPAHPAWAAQSPCRGQGHSVSGRSAGPMPPTWPWALTRRLRTCRCTFSSWALVAPGCHTSLCVQLRGPGTSFATTVYVCENERADSSLQETWAQLGWGVPQGMRSGQQV